MSRFFKRLPLRSILLLGALVGLQGCSDGPALVTSPGANQDARPGLVRVEAADGTFSAVVEDDLRVQSFDGAIMGATQDGAFRVYIARLKEDTLLRLAGSGKDTMVARGWTVDGEHHFEKAIHVELKRGGTRDAPEERRDVWWFNRGGGLFLCDGIARPDSFFRLGAPFQAGCRHVVVRTPGESPTAP